MKKALCFFKPQEIVYLRICSAAIVLLPYSLPQLRKLTLRQYKLLTLVGVVGTLLPLFCFAKAQLHINSGVHGVLNSLTPVFVLIVGIIFFRKRLFRNEILGVSLGILGTVLLMIIESRFFAGSFNYYILLSLLGSCLYGNTTNLIKYYLNDVKSTTIVSVSLLLIGIIGSIYLVTHPNIFIKINTSNESYKALAYILFAGIVNLGIANIILTELVKITSPVFTSTEALLAPIVSLSWGLVDGEQLLWEHYIGAIIILLGVYFINKPKKGISKKEAFIEQI
jgi:drug/metabolite transporter (DMT)-like permease